MSRITYKKAILGQKPSYWKLLFLIKAIAKKVNLLQIKVSRILHGESTDDSTAIAIVRTVICGVIVSAFVLFLCFRVDNITEKIVGAYLNIEIIKEKDGYENFVASVLGVIGVFLGIYFAVLSNLATSVYSPFSTQLMDVFLRDKTSNRYVKFLSIFAVFLVLLFGAKVLFLKESATAIAISVVATPCSIFAFIELGKYLFFLSSPTAFLQKLTKRFHSIITKVSRKNQQPDKNSLYQEYYRLESKNTLSIFNFIDEYTKRGGMRAGGSNIRVLANERDCILRYIAAKHSIPTECGWFEKISVYPKWYEINDLKLTIPLKTGTQIIPDRIINEYWLEDLAINEMLRSVKEDCGGKMTTQTLQRIRNYLVIISDIVSGLSSNWSTKHAIEILNSITSEILKILGKNKDIDEENKKYLASIVELITRMPVVILLGFSNTISSADLNILNEYVSKINWRNGKNLYSIKLPRAVISNLEFIYKQINAELETNNITRTPDWYIMEQIRHGIALWCEENWGEIIKLIEEWYNATSARCLKIDPIYAAIVSSQNNEMYVKLEYHFANIREKVTELEKDSRIDFVKKTTWNWGQEEKRIMSIKDCVISMQAEIIAPLAQCQTDEKYPDYLGGAVTNVGVFCYKTLADADAESFKKYFKQYFEGVIAIYAKTLTKKNAICQNELSNIIKPMRELLILSGYAYIYAELYAKKTIWEICKKIWDDYLERAHQALRPLAAMIHLMQSSWNMPGRYELEFEWERELIGKFETLPTKWGRYGEQIIEHDSPLVKKMASGSNCFLRLAFSPLEIFATKYLLKIEGAKELNFGIDEGTIRRINDEK